MGDNDDKKVPVHVALISGAFAGIGVDITLFPLDTLKTRLQSKEGFVKSGGFSRLWAGIGPVAIGKHNNLINSMICISTFTCDLMSILGSAPSAAAFFVTYEMGKNHVFPKISSNQTLAHMGSACLGEISACIVRVPVEVIKQRTQVSTSKTQSMTILKQTIKSEGFSGLYRGYFSTVMREIPFSVIQFPIWEWLKRKVLEHTNQFTIRPEQSAVCGAIAGIYTQYRFPFSK